MERMIGPKNTARFQWPAGDEFPAMDRDQFGKDVLIGACHLKPEDVLCLQDNPREKGYDVTFFEWSTLMRVKDIIVRQRDTRIIGVSMTPLSSKRLRFVTVHMYDPHVTSEAIVAFLGKFGRVYPEKEKKVLDNAGFWTGKRTFPVVLKSDPMGYDELLHPPAFFTIGADRGYLSYHRQPPFCKKCRGSGHREKDCKKGAICRFCSSKEHEAKDCTRAKDCHACGSAGHLLKDCPVRSGTGGVGPRRDLVKEKAGDAGPSSPAGEGGKIAQQAVLRTTTAVRAAKDGARTGSQAFNGAGAAGETSAEKKVRMDGEREEEMDSESEESEEDIPGGGPEGEKVTVLSFDSGLPACLFGPASPRTEHWVTPEWAEQGKKEGPK